MKLSRIVVLCALVCLCAVAQAQTSKQSNGSLERGKYLVNNVGMCHDCHTPRNERGEEIKEKWLQGSPLPFQPMVEMPWVGTAPPIAGLEGWTDAQAIKFLTTGIKKDGKSATPPMPGYRFSKADAAAVVSYLRTMKPAGKQVSAETKPATR